MTDEKKQRLHIEKLIRDDRVNVHLEQAETDPTTLRFKSGLRRGLRFQIAAVAVEEIVDRLLMFVKGRKNIPLITEVSTLLARKSVGNYVDFEAWLVWAGTQGGQAALDKLDLDGVFRLTNPELTNFFADHSNMIIRSVDRYSAEWLSSQIVQGKEKGLPPKEIARLIAERSPDFTQMRAERIVMTELANAMTVVELQAATKMGIEEKIWRTSQDELVCPICLPLDGTKLNIRSNFSAVSPNDDIRLVVGPPAHPNCRCFIEEVIPRAWEENLNNVWLGN